MTHFELLQVPLELALVRGVQGGVLDVILAEGRTENVEDVGPRREDKDLGLGFVGLNLDQGADDGGHLGGERSLDLLVHLGLVRGLIIVVLPRKIIQIYLT